jgi:hypothetical protein
MKSLYNYHKQFYAHALFILLFQVQIAVVHSVTQNIYTLGKTTKEQSTDSNCYVIKWSALDQTRLISSARLETTVEFYIVLIVDFSYLKNGFNSFSSIKIQLYPPLTHQIGNGLLQVFKRK